MKLVLQAISIHYMLNYVFNFLFIWKWLCTVYTHSPVERAGLVHTIPPPQGCWHTHYHVHCHHGNEELMNQGTYNSCFFCLTGWVTNSIPGCMLRAETTTGMESVHASKLKRVRISVSGVVALHRSSINSNSASDLFCQSRSHVQISPCVMRLAAQNKTMAPTVMNLSRLSVIWTIACSFSSTCQGGQSCSATVGSRSGLLFIENLYKRR